MLYTAPIASSPPLPPWLRYRCLRDAVGFGPHLQHDAHHRLTPIEAARLGKELEPFSLFWLEDATPADNYRFEDGYLVMDEVPGLGVDIDEALAAKYPYERAYLPVARLADGSMWHW